MQRLSTEQQAGQRSGCGVSLQGGDGSMPRFAGSTCCRTWKRFEQTGDQRPPRATCSQNLKEEQKDCDLRIGAGRTRGEPVAAGVQNGH